MTFEEKRLRGCEACDQLITYAKDWSLVDCMIITGKEFLDGIKESNAWWSEEAEYAESVVEDMKANEYLIMVPGTDIIRRKVTRKEAEAILDSREALINHVCEINGTSF